LRAAGTVYLDLHGSYARETQIEPSSDVDLIAEFDGNVNDFRPDPILATHSDGIAIRVRPAGEDAVESRRVRVSR
jgi:predicted nucleotidyltransferase